ncbi:unnamed protein product [Ilex paraguariensis]|uniref:Transmembrane protein n=1 Tax=Ilex paraguariensis TaxID=185542 RepID=A0ABC8T9G4_9AQUA
MDQTLRAYYERERQRQRERVSHIRWGIRCSSTNTGALVVINPATPMDFQPRSSSGHKQSTMVILLTLGLGWWFMMVVVLGWGFSMVLVLGVSGGGSVVPGGFEWWCCWAEGFLWWRCWGYGIVMVVLLVVLDVGGARAVG